MNGLYTHLSDEDYLRQCRHASDGSRDLKGGFCGVDFNMLAVSQYVEVSIFLKSVFIYRFIPRKELRKQNRWWSNCLLFFIFVKETYIELSNAIGNSPIGNHENVLSPEGTLRKQNPY